MATEQTNVGGLTPVIGELVDAVDLPVEDGSGQTPPPTRAFPVVNGKPVIPPGVKVVTAPAKPPTPAIQRPSLVAQAQASSAALPPKLPKGLTLFNTRDLDNGFFHFVVYSETSARKTSTACSFETPEFTRIILTRRREQMKPLQDQGYQVALVDNADALLYAFRNPHILWPDWAAMSDPDRRRTLILDDATEAVQMLLESNEVINGKEVKDNRRKYAATGDDLHDVLKPLLNKPFHFGMVALAKVKEAPLTNEETIGPDMPPSMLNMVLTEFEYVFYINTKTWKLLTDRDRIAYVGQDPDNPNKDKTFYRAIFAKCKVPMSYLGKGIVKKEEDLNLNALWKKLCAGTGAANPTVKK